MLPSIQELQIARIRSWPNLQGDISISGFKICFKLQRPEKIGILQKFSRGSMLQLVAAELFSRAHGLMQSSSTSKEQPKASQASQNVAIASPKAHSVSIQRAAPVSPKASSRSKQQAEASSPKASSGSKKKAEKSEGAWLDTNVTTAEKKQSRLDRKLSAKRKDREGERGKTFGIALSPSSKRQRGEVPASEQKSKASKASKKAKGTKMVVAAGASGPQALKDRQTEASSKEVVQRGNRRGKGPGRKVMEKKAPVGKQKRQSTIAEDEEEVEPQESASPPQKAKQSKKAVTSRKAKQVQQTTGTR